MFYESIWKKITVTQLLLRALCVKTIHLKLKLLEVLLVYFKLVLKALFVKKIVLWGKEP